MGRICTHLAFERSWRSHCCVRSEYYDFLEGGYVFELYRLFEMKYVQEALFLHEHDEEAAARAELKLCSCVLAFVLVSTECDWTFGVTSLSSGLLHHVPTAQMLEAAYFGNVSIPPKHWVSPFMHPPSMNSTTPFTDPNHLNSPRPAGFLSCSLLRLSLSLSALPPLLCSSTCAMILSIAPCVGS